MSTEPESQPVYLSGFQADRPKQDPSQDCLSRAGFAENLASKIAAWNQQDSLVIGLEGAWGSGKSTIKNFILHYLEKKEPKIATVEFNPWQFSGDDRLFEEFASAIASILPASGPAAVERQQLWAKYSSYLAFGGKFTEALKVAASFSGIPGATVLLDQATQTLDALGGLAKRGGDTIDSDVKSLQSIKGKLSNAFRKLDQPVLVIIDDIDRLTDEEVALIFRLVKANADFPNIVYLLVYDRQYVEESLDKITSSKGSEFLQKIVQMPIPVPAPQIQRVHKELFICLDRILAVISEDPASKWDNERWVNLWVRGMSVYFADLRRVYRYTNSCAFLAGNLRDNNYSEVDVIDFFALEVLRIFEKPVYDRVKVSGRLITGLQVEEWEDDSFENLLKDLLEFASNKNAVEEVLSTLFLKIRSKWKNTGYSESHMREATAKMRVCSPEHFPKYFQLALPDGMLSRSRVIEVLQNLNSRDILKRIFDDAIRTEFIVPLLQALGHHHSIDKLEDPSSYLLALCDTVDLLPETRVPIEGGMIDVDPSTFVTWAVLRSCENGQNNKKKARLLEKIILDSNGLYMSADILWRWQSWTEEQDDTTQLPTLDSKRGVHLRKHVVTNLEEWAHSGRLIKHPFRGRLIYFWNQWQPEQCQQWFRHQLMNRETARLLVPAYLNQRSSQVLGSVYERTHEYFDYKYMEKLAPLDEWKSAIEHIVEEDPQGEFSARIKSALRHSEVKS